MCLQSYFWEAGARTGGAGVASDILSVAREVGSLAHIPATLRQSLTRCISLRAVLDFHSSGMATVYKRDTHGVVSWRAAEGGRRAPAAA